MAFGDKIASDYKDTGGGEWIRGFKDDETQIRIMPAVNVNRKGHDVYGSSAWPQEYEHFDRDLQIGYPCTGEDDCVGCNHSDKQVRATKKKIYIFALDEDGTPRIFRMGPMLYKRFKVKEQRQLAKNPKNLQPLSDRDYIVLRSGKGMNTEYDCEAGDEVYEVEWPDDDELPDLAESLQQAYDDAVDIYEGENLPRADEDDEDDAPRARKKSAARKRAPESEEDEEETPRPRRKAATRKRAPEPEEDEDEEEIEEEPKPRKKTATRKRAAAKPEPEEDEDEEDEEEPAPRKRAAKRGGLSSAKKSKAEPEPEEDEEESEGLGHNPREDDIRAASTADLRAYLDEHDIEYPPRAPRKRLIEIAIDTPPY